jgi:hypothetical protein
MGLLFIKHAPDLPPTIIRDQERAIGQLEQTHRPSPDLTLFWIEHPTREEILGAGDRLTFFKGYKGDDGFPPLGPSPPPHARPTGPRALPDPLDLVPPGDRLLRNSGATR